MKNEMTKKLLKLVEKNSPRNYGTVIEVKAGYTTYTDGFYLVRISETSYPDGVYSPTGMPLPYMKYPNTARIIPDQIAPIDIDKANHFLQVCGLIKPDKKSKCVDIGLDGLISGKAFSTFNLQHVKNILSILPSPELYLSAEGNILVFKQGESLGLVVAIRKED